MASIKMNPAYEERLQKKREAERARLEQIVDHPLSKREARQRARYYALDSSPMSKVLDAASIMSAGLAGGTLVDAYSKNPTAAKSLGGTLAGATVGAGIGYGLDRLGGSIAAHRDRVMSYASPETKRAYAKSRLRLDRANDAFNKDPKNPVMEERLMNALSHSIRMEQEAKAEGKANLALAKAERRKAQKTAMYEDMIMEKAASMMY